MIGDVYTIMLKKKPKVNFGAFFVYWSMNIQIDQLMIKNKHQQRVYDYYVNFLHWSWTIQPTLITLVFFELTTFIIYVVLSGFQLR